VYILVSLLFVVATMIEFSVVLIVKQTSDLKTNIRHSTTGNTRVTAVQSKRIFALSNKVNEANIDKHDSSIFTDKINGEEKERNSSLEKHGIFNSFSIVNKIDCAAFFLFLFAYFVFNLAYWIKCLST
jgi:hypothetical protein